MGPDLSGKQADYRGEMCAGGGVGGNVQTGGQQRHQRMGHIVVVAVARADEGAAVPALSPVLK